MQHSVRTSVLPSALLGFGRIISVCQPTKSGQSPAIPKLPGALLDKINALTAQALLHNPVNSHTLLLIGQVATEAGDKVRAKAFMTLAVGQSRHETLAGLWQHFERFADHDSYFGWPIRQRRPSVRI